MGRAEPGGGGVGRAHQDKGMEGAGGAGEGVPGDPCSSPESPQGGHMTPLRQGQPLPLLAMRW